MRREPVEAHRATVGTRVIIRDDDETLDGFVHALKLYGLMAGPDKPREGHEPFISSFYTYSQVVLYYNLVP